MIGVTRRFIVLQQLVPAKPSQEQRRSCSGCKCKEVIRVHKAGHKEVREERASIDQDACRQQGELSDKRCQ